MASLTNYRLWISPRKKRFWAVILLLLYTVTGFLIAPAVLRQQLEPMLSSLLQRPVSIEKITFNPYSLRATVDRFRLLETDDSDLFSFEQLIINFQLSSIFNRAWTFREISLVRPDITLAREKFGLLNLQQLLPKSDDDTAEKEPTAIPSLLFHSIKIVEGKLDFIDRTKATPYATWLTPIDLHLTDLSTQQGRLGHHIIQLSGESGVDMALQGNLTAVPFNLEGTLHASGPYLPLVYGYFEEMLNIAVNKGDLNLQLNFKLSEQPNGFNVDITTDNLSIDNILIVDKSDKSDMLTLEQIDLESFRFSWPDKVLHAALVAVKTPNINLLRSADASINWQRVLAESAQNETALSSPPVEQATGMAASAEPVTDANANANANANAKSVSSAAETNTDKNTLLADWKISLSAFKLANMQVNFTDQQLENPETLALKNTTIDVENISNMTGAEFPVQLSADLGKGKITFRGAAHLLPDWGAKGDFSIENLPLTLGGGYVGHYLNASLASGDLTSKGTVESSADNLLGLGADIQITKLNFLREPSKQPLVQWETLAIQGFEFALTPGAIKSAKITLDDPYLRFRIREDGSNNLQRLVKATPTTESKSVSEQNTQSRESTDSPPIAITVNEIASNKATVDFTDNALPIPFDNRLSKLTGEVTGISTADKIPGTLDFKGQVGEYGSVEVTGTVSPWEFTEQTEIILDLKNVDMPDLKPYSVKFVGREIDNGRMNFNLDYKFKDGILKGDNELVLTRFELGKKVPYEGALNLPLDLAVALLKGPDGTIDINLPVSGDTSSPEFSIGGIVLKVFANLITKAVTAPFKLLGALVGASDDNFDKIFFEPGSAEISPPEREKLDKLVEALSQRPQLGLEIKGVYASSTDIDAIKTQRLNEQIDAARLEAYGEGSTTPRSQQRLTVMERMLKTNYGNEVFEALREKHPPSEEGARPEQYRTEISNKLLDSIAVEPEALTNLASERGQKIAVFLGGDDRVEAARISLGDPEAVKKATKAGIPLKLTVTDVK